MRLAQRLSLVVLVALLLPPAVGRAQGMVPERVHRSMDETDRRIELAETVVSGSEDAQARGGLALAMERQGRARLAAGSGRFAVAGQLTAEARGHADRAIMLGRGLPTRERLRAQWNRTGEMLERSGPRIEECGDGRARALLRAALEMQERSGNAEAAGRYLGALQLTMGARERCLRALRLCGLEEGVQQVAKRALNRTDEVLARARRALEFGTSGGSASPRLRDALDRATVLQGDAERQFQDGRHETSLQLTLAARRLAQRVLARGPRAR
jgi:hypothetical protein